MKRIFSILLCICLIACLAVEVFAASAVETLESTYAAMRPALIIIAIIAIVLVLTSIIATVVMIGFRKNNRKGNLVLQCILYLVTAVVLVCAIFCFIRYRQVGALLQSEIAQPSESTSIADNTEPLTENTTEATEAPTEETTEPPAPTEPPLPTLSPAMTENSDPANWGVKWQLEVNGERVESYQSADTYNFTAGSDYFALPGVPTFRGDNYRTGAAYGTAQVSQKTLTKKWDRGIGSLNDWPGIGWTGQPLCVQWDEETKAIMNLYDEKKAKEGLVEVIATTLDGNIYFYDMDDGSYTRDPLWIGMSFKGTASLDPRGYPILYAGSGLTNGDKYPRMYIISLIDCSLLMERSGGDNFAYRGWYAFDSSPMISGETDTLFWPGESGVVYAIKLNTEYDKTAGTLSMSPEILAKTRYATDLNRTVGYEASAIMVGNYMFIGDNGGMFYCIDLHTMQLAWTQCVEDDVNATPVFEWGDDGEGYLYVATSTEYTGNCSYIYKLNASTGEIVWSKLYDNVAYDYDVSGGALSSPVLGKKGTNLEGMLICSISKTPGAWSGTLVALDTETGEEIWERTLSTYAWSSPVGIYTEDGTGYLILGDASGYIFLIDGLTGETLYTDGLGSNIEASPVVFNNKLVVGTRGCQVWGVEIN